MDGWVIWVRKRSNRQCGPFQTGSQPSLLPNTSLESLLKPDYKARWRADIEDLGIWRAHSKSYEDFWLGGRLGPPIPALFKGQLYISRYKKNVTMSQRSKTLLLLPQFKQICFLVSHRLPSFSDPLLLLWSTVDAVGGQGMTLHSAKKAWRHSTDSVPHNSWEMSITWPLGREELQVFSPQLSVPSMSFCKPSCSFRIRFSCLGWWLEWQIGFPLYTKSSWLVGSAWNSALKRILREDRQNTYDMLVFYELDIIYKKLLR